MVAHEDLQGCKVLIFANKQDAKGALPAAEISKQLNLAALPNGTSWHIQDCCALTGEGLYDGTRVCPTPPLQCNFLPAAIVVCMYVCMYVFPASAWTSDSC